jgi:hypothetical protein
MPGDVLMALAQFAGQTVETAAVTDGADPPAACGTTRPELEQAREAQAAR